VLIRQINIFAEKLVLKVYELADFVKGSQNYSEWRPYRESNPAESFQIVSQKASIIRSNKGQNSDF
jgi:hypothetical protein